MAIQSGFSGGYTISTGSTTLPYMPTGSTATKPPPPPCDHVMGDETELDDGRIAGHCSKCGDKILGRRMVGGLGLAKLKAALVDAIGDEGALAGLADELQRVEKMLELERQSIDAAECLMETARRMIEELLEV